MNQPCVCTTIRKANRALFRFYEEALAQSDLTVVQFAILRSLQRNGATPLSRIADEQFMERTSLYRTIAPLRKMGAVSIRTADKGKTKIAKLTNTGTGLIDQTLPFWESAQETVVTRIGSKNWEALSKTILGIPELLADV